MVRKLQYSMSAFVVGGATYLRNGGLVAIGMIVVDTVQQRPVVTNGSLSAVCPSTMLLQSPGVGDKRLGISQGARTPNLVFARVLSLGRRTHRREQ